MTPEQFSAKMRYISQLPADRERTHKRLVEAMADVLEDLGYKDGVRYFRETEEDESWSVRDAVVKPKLLTYATGKRPTIHIENISV